MAVGTKVTIDRGDFTIECTDYGSGPAVVLYHGMGMFPGTWWHHVDVLVAAGYRVITPALRGFPGAQGPTDIASFGAQDTIDDFVATLDQLGIEQAAVFAGDIAAETVWDLPVVVPDRVSCIGVFGMTRPKWVPGTKPFDLFAIAASGGFLGDPFFLTYIKSGELARELAAEPGNSSEFVRKLQHVRLPLRTDGQTPSWFYGPIPKTGMLPAMDGDEEVSWIGEKEWQELYDFYNQVDWAAALQWYVALNERWAYWMERTAQNITHPVMFLAGTLDSHREMMGPAGWKAWHSTVDGPLVEKDFEAVGNIAACEAREETAQAMKEFLASHFPAS